MLLAKLIYAAPVILLAVSVQSQVEDPGCPCNTDVVFLVHRSGGIEKNELDNVKDFLERILQRISDQGHEDCFRTAAISFSRKAKVEFGFDADTSTALASIQNIRRPRGNGRADQALNEANKLLNSDANPTRDGCRNVVLITDGSSDNKEKTLAAAANLMKGTNARMLIVKMLNPAATAKQQCNRDTEIEGILSNSREGSQQVFEFNFGSGKVEDEHVDAMLGSLCEACVDDCICSIADGDLIPCSGDSIPLTGSNGNNVLTQRDGTVTEVVPGPGNRGIGQVIIRTPTLDEPIVLSYLSGKLDVSVGPLNLGEVSDLKIGGIRVMHTNAQDPPDPDVILTVITSDETWVFYREGDSLHMPENQSSPGQPPLSAKFYTNSGEIAGLCSRTRTSRPAT